VTVFHGSSLGSSLAIFINGDCGFEARRTRRTKATDTDLYIFISNGKRVFGLFCGTNRSFRGTKTVFGVQRRSLIEQIALSS
jgi:hypothetical protein